MKGIGRAICLVGVLVGGCVDEPDGAEVLRFDFESTNGNLVEDSSGNDNDGSTSGTADTGSSEGWSGASLDVDGGGVLVPYSPELALDDALTFELWINPRELGTTAAILITDQVADEQPLLSHELTITTMGLTFSSNDCDDVVELRKQTNIPLNAWTHLAVTWNGQRVEFYRDAESIFRAPLRNVCATENDLRLGRISEGQQFRGLIDEVIVSDFAKSEGQILETVNGGTGLYGCTVSRSPRTSSWMLWLGVMAFASARRRRRR